MEKEFKTMKQNLNKAENYNKVFEEVVTNLACEMRRLVILHTRLEQGEAEFKDAPEMVIPRYIKYAAKNINKLCKKKGFDVKDLDIIATVRENWFEFIDNEDLELGSFTTLGSDPEGRSAEIIILTSCKKDNDVRPIITVVEEVADKKAMKEIDTLIEDPQGPHVMKSMVDTALPVALALVTEAYIQKELQYQEVAAILDEGKLQKEENNEKETSDDAEDIVATLQNVFNLFENAEKPDYKKDISGVLNDTELPLSKKLRALDDVLNEIEKSLLARRKGLMELEKILNLMDNDSKEDK